MTSAAEAWQLVEDTIVRCNPAMRAEVIRDRIEPLRAYFVPPGVTEDRQAFARMGAERERKRIVEYLRSFSGSDALRIAADMIENCKHLR